VNLDPPTGNADKPGPGNSGWPSGPARLDIDPLLHGLVPSVDPLEPRHLSDYFRVLYKRRWVASIAFVVTVIVTALYTYTRVPVYQSSVRVLLSQQRQNYGFKELPGTETGFEYQTQYAILRSRSLVKKTMKSLGIWREVPKGGGSPAAADVQPVAETKSTGFKAVVVDLIGTVLGRPPAASVPSSPEANESAAEARQIDGFLSGLRVMPIAGSGIVDVTYTSSNPLVTAQYSNALAREYVNQNLELKFDASKEVSDWLAERLVEQKARVQSSEQALQRYRERNSVVSLDERGSLIVQGLAELTAQVTKARTDRIEKETLYNQLRAIQGDRAALESLLPIAGSAAVQQAKVDLTNAQRRAAELSEKLGDRHPDLIRARDGVKAAEEHVDVEIAKVADAIRLDFEKARTTEMGLTQTLDDQKREALASNRGGVELAVLMRDVESNRQVYDTMINKAKEAGISGEIKTNNVRILDAAEVPRAPIFPNTAKNMQMGILGGLVLAIGLVFLFEYLDNRIKTPDEIKAHLGLPFLGLVPKFANDERTPLLTSGVSPKFAEALRTVRTNVLFSSAEERGRTVLVASAGPGEGKTLVASNLAIALAQAGQRVLIIDGDLRRPRLHDVFGVKQEPGLSNLIVGDAKPADVIRTSAAGVTVVPSGRIPPNPAELLGSRRFHELLTRLKEHFDWVVIDSAPVMAVTDAAVVGHMVSGVVFVVSSEMTNRYNARTALDHLAAARSHVLGAVLNRVDLDGHSYYYARYYRREYGEYYQSRQVS
jgi:polysaccharide biosynthesis transport protein